MKILDSLTKKEKELELMFPMWNITIGNHCVVFQKKGLIPDVGWIKITEEHFISSDSVFKSDIDEVYNLFMRI